MRNVTTALVVGIVVAQAGCTPEYLRPFKDRRGPAAPGELPTKERLVEYLNENSKRVDSVSSRSISLTCYYRLLPPMGLEAKMVCEKPRNLRLAAYSGVGGTEVDLGSNAQEFWWWIKRDPTNAQFYCSYKDLEEGRVRVVPFPFQPEWIMEAMGIGNYGTPDLYAGVWPDKDNTIKLVRQTRSPQGAEVLKVIYFNGKQTDVAKGVAQVVQHQLIDKKTKTVLVSAQITKVQFDPVSGSVLPKVMTLNWPAERLKLTMNFDNLVVNAPVGNQGVFARTPINNAQAVDLARLPGTTTGLQRVQGRGP
jgi:hypothetical protein